MITGLGLVWFMPP